MSSMPVPYAHIASPGKIIEEVPFVLNFSDFSMVSGKEQGSVCWAVEKLGLLDITVDL